MDDRSHDNKELKILEHWKDFTKADEQNADKFLQQLKTARGIPLPLAGTSPREDAAQNAERNEDTKATLKAIVPNNANGEPKDAPTLTAEILNALMPVSVTRAFKASSDLPDCIITRAPTNETTPWDATGRVVSVGGVGVLTGAGGMGKSYLTLGLALAAATAKADGKPVERAMGLCVKAGDVVLVSYEDDATWVKHRLQTMDASNDALQHLYILNPGPLFVCDSTGATQYAAGWDVLATVTALVRPALVIIDPASMALENAGAAHSGPVRTLFNALQADGHRHGYGALLVAHDTKAARNDAAKGQDPGAGVVAGNAAWYDAARGVMRLQRGTDQATRGLISEKANHGRTGWVVGLEEAASSTGDFAGLRDLTRNGTTVTYDTVTEWKAAECVPATDNGNNPKKGKLDDVDTRLRQA